MIHRKLFSGLWIPKYTRTGRDVGKSLTREQQRTLEQPISRISYVQKMLLLLLLEHRQEEVDIHNYDMVDAKMKTANTFLALTVS